MQDDYKFVLLLFCYLKSHRLGNWYLYRHKCKYIGKHTDSSCTVVYNLIYIHLIYYGNYLSICHTDLYIKSLFYDRDVSNTNNRVVFETKILNYYTEVSVYWSIGIVFDFLHPYCTIFTIILYYLRISETTMVGPS